MGGGGEGGISKLNFYVNILNSGSSSAGRHQPATAGGRGHQPGSGHPGSAGILCSAADSGIHTPLPSKQEPTVSAWLDLNM